MSGKIRFISDPHFGHKNMAIKRGFHNEFYHDEYIIDSWNKVVNKSDTTWILGDITMEKRDYQILNRLKGFKRVILGNHDGYKINDKRYINVCMEVQDYTPKTLEELIKK